MNEIMSDKKKYWDGTHNKIIRHYFYLMKGVALFNDLRYLILAVFGLYIVLKLSNPVWLVLMFCVSLPILIFFGWLSVHKLAKVMEWLTIEFSTYWARYQFDLQERSVKALENIEKEIKKDIIPW